MTIYIIGIVAGALWGLWSNDRATSNFNTKLHTPRVRAQAAVIGAVIGLIAAAFAVYAAQVVLSLT